MVKYLKKNYDNFYKNKKKINGEPRQNKKF